MKLRGKTAATAAPDARTFVVSGRVFSAERAGVNGLRVDVVDKNVGADAGLASGVTDAQGVYRIAYSVAPIRKQRKDAPDIQVRVFTGKTFLGASEVRYNAAAAETLDVLLPAASADALPSEYDTLTGAIASHYKGQLRDLKETDDRPDITYLANKTGWDARAVALAALADQFSQRSGRAKIPPVFFYALFRAGLPANEDIVYHADAKTLEAVWKGAAKQGVIPKAQAREIPGLIQRFQTLSAQKLLTGPALVGVSSLKEMLAVSRLDAAKQAKFAELYAAHRTDMPAFWKAAAKAFGKDTANRLQVDGKLAFLTINNAPLMQKLHKIAGGKGLSDPRQLAQLGYHSNRRRSPDGRGISEPKQGKWDALLTQDVPIPQEIPGDSPEAKRANYAEYLAAQVRLSYPTASVAEIVHSEKLAGGDSEQVHAFLTQHQGKFEIGVQPVEQYRRRNKIKDAPEAAIKQVKRIQRVFQITPSDEAMIGLLKRGVDAAYHVVRYQKESFVRSFATDLGGEDQAGLTYDRAVQVHNAVLNVATSYLTASNAPGIGVHSPAQIIDPAPTPPANADDVIASATLESLWGGMDYCTCDHCRSILSPAAYLVDLLGFIDVTPEAAKNPQAVLLDRRPDIQHLPLTCENTNTALPYIDVVNETLEYFIANNVQKLSLNDYAGHDTGEAASEDLLASPQFVMDSAYTALNEARFPAPLPFHQSLESLRRYFDKFEVPLPLAMERLRKNDDLERGANPYGWLDILMEEIGLSRTEYKILTTSNAAPDVLWQIYGYPAGTSDTDIVNGNQAANIVALSNAKQFTRRVGVTYENLIAILKTKFVNPNGDLITLAVPVRTWAASTAYLPGDCVKQVAPPAAGSTLYYECTTAGTSAASEPTWPSAPGSTLIDGNVTWTCRDASICSSFDNLAFRHVNADESIGVAEFVRLLRFIRLWKKAGWTIEQTDAAICALFPPPVAPQTFADTIDTVAKLDSRFLALLPRIGIVIRVMKALNLTPKRDLLPLLACFAPIDVHDGIEWLINQDNGRYQQTVPSLYRRMFLNLAILQQDPVFADNGSGEFLADDPLHPKVAEHVEALRSAFSLTGDEYDRIADALGYDANTPLTLANISAIYRRGWLARKLGLSVREFLLLTSLTGVDPFAAPDIAMQPAAPTPPVPPQPPILQLIALVQALRDRSLKSAVALYLIWNQDLSGKSAPPAAQVTEFARTLRGDFAGIEDQFAATEDPGGDIARARMTLVYGQEAADSFFALLDDTLILDVAYTHPVQALEVAISAADAKITYDDFRHRLSYTGVLTVAYRDTLKTVPGVTLAFQMAVDVLFAKSEDAKGSFFARYQELKPLYDNTLALNNTLVLNVDYTHSAVTLDATITAADSRISYDDINHRLSYAGVLTVAHRDTLKTVPGVTLAFQAAVDALFARSQEAKGAVLAALRPELSRRRKRQQALQRLSAAATTDLIFTQALLDASAAPYPLHAAGDNNQPVLNDVLALETPGLAVQFFFRNTATGAVGLSVPAASNLDYASGGNNPLPANTAAPGNAISGIWNGQVETPEAGYFNFIIETDSGATVTLTLGGQARSLTQNGTLWRNTGPLELKAETLYDIVLTVAKVKDALSVKWETPKRTREVIPSRYLYPPTILAPFSDAYIRFLKAASLAAGLGLTANEMAYFATRSDYQIAGDGWLNVLPVSGNSADPAALLKPFQALLDYARIKVDLAPDDERLLTVLEDPVAATASPDDLLYALTHWDAASLTKLLNQFDRNIADLSHLEWFVRVYDAFALIRKMGISGSALIGATTNEPVGDTVRALQAALRARYDTAAWRDVVRPINDAMRGLQRDALVAYILHQMRSSAESAHIDTADKLFEYFLMDVEMEPCMQTSRIRHALSSVQLFIERCLMNLERDVSPAAINAKQWEWMKRYRVWEANRKVFLFPENWLEPELRDDKSPFFKEIESELLQSDITEDSAATALLNYLSKLEEVAKLEPCGIYHVEADPSKQTGDVDHVIARTAGAHRKYYYRRHEYGYWTPWEQIKLDIEDNPVIPVVWNNRFLLFWLRILKQAPDAAMQAPSGELKNPMQISDAITPGAMQVGVRAVLCWSEYYNGKWQPTKTSDVDRPAELGSFPPASGDAFDRSNLQLSVVEQMAIPIHRPDDTMAKGVWI